MSASKIITGNLNWGEAQARLQNRRSFVGDVRFVWG